MPNLILIKHASPQVKPGLPPETWALAEKGRQQCKPLAEAIRPLAPAVMLTSMEPKAAQTGELIATDLGIPFATVAGLHEHDRSNVPHMASREFISHVELFFRKPGELVLGRETADQALTRFDLAVQGVLSRYPDQNIAIVSHGTVIALLLARAMSAGANSGVAASAAANGAVSTSNTVEGFDLWRRMGLPSYAVLQTPEMSVLQVVDQV